MDVVGETLAVAIVAAVPAILSYLQGRANGKGVGEIIENSHELRAKSDQIHDLVNSKMTQALLTIEAQDLKLTSALTTIATQQAEIQKLQKLVMGLQTRLAQL